MFVLFTGDKEFSDLLESSESRFSVTVFFRFALFKCIRSVVPKLKAVQKVAVVAW